MSGRCGCALTCWSGSPAAAEQALGHVGLGGYGARVIHTLSGGEQQRVAIARLLLRTPRLVLADEPTGSLDPNHRDQVLKHLSGFATRGAAVIVVTHDPVVAAWADREYHIALLDGDTRGHSAGKPSRHDGAGRGDMD